MAANAAAANAPQNNTPMLGVHAREAGLARLLKMDDQPSRLGDHGRYRSTRINFA